MPIKNYTTTVTAVQSVSEISGMLAAHGAQRVQQEYQGGSPVSVAFQIDTPMGVRGFFLPANVDRVAAVLKKQHVKTEADRAQRVAWRILRDWVAAQMAILETEMVTIDEIFLPYMADRDGRTVYQLYESNQLMLGSESEAQK